jgi:hypothetical protein
LAWPGACAAARQYAKQGNGRNRSELESTVESHVTILLAGWILS